MAEDVTSVLRRKESVLKVPQHEGPVPGDLASEILRGDGPDLALEMPRLEHILEGRSALEPLGPATFDDAVPFARRSASSMWRRSISSRVTKESAGRATVPSMGGESPEGPDAGTGSRRATRVRSRVGGRSAMPSEPPRAVATA
jgi:hypothetical protein